MKNIFFILGVLFISGCSAAQHAEQLLTLKALADEQDNLQQVVDRQNQRFEALLELFKSAQHERYKKEKDFRKHFGAPIYKKEVIRNGEARTLWVYRYSTQYFDSEKVHLYFDSKGKLSEWEVFENK